MIGLTHEDEHYVRLYQRDTLDWKMLPWEARALYPLLLRKMDRLGRFTMGRHGLDGVAFDVGLPDEIVRAGMPALLTEGYVTQDGDTLIAAEFVHAQECGASDRARQAAHREAARVGLVAVTKRDRTSRNVTESHDASRGVTDGHPVLRSATPSVPSVPTTSAVATAPPVESAVGHCSGCTHTVGYVQHLCPEHRAVARNVTDGLIDFDGAFPESQANTGGYDGSVRTREVPSEDSVRTSGATPATPPAKQPTLPGVPPVVPAPPNAANGREEALAGKPARGRKAKKTLSPELLAAEREAKPVILAAYMRLWPGAGVVGFDGKDVFALRAVLKRRPAADIVRAMEGLAPDAKYGSKLSLRGVLSEANVQRGLLALAPASVPPAPVSEPEPPPRVMTDEDRARSDAARIAARESLFGKRGAA